MPRRPKGLSQAEEDLHAAIESIYAAAAEPALWQGTLRRVADLMDSDVSMFSIVDLEDHGDRFHADFGLNPEATAAYFAHYWKLEPFAPIMLAQPQGAVVLGSALCPNEALVKTEYFNDFVRKYYTHLVREDRDAELVSAVAVADGAMHSNLSFMRGVSRGPFEPDELRKLAVLLPHLTRAVRIQDKLAKSAALPQALLSTIDQLSDGVLILDGRGAVIAMNRVGRAIVSEGDGLALTKEGLQAANAEETVKLEEFLASRGHAVGAGLVNGSGYLSLSRPSGKRPYAVLVCPLVRPEEATARSRPVAAVFITDPERGSELPEVALRRLFRLTPAEARLAAALAQGRTLKEISEAEGISPHTLRHHLKQVFLKTDTHRQAELVRLLNASVNTMILPPAD